MEVKCSHRGADPQLREPAIGGQEILVAEVLVELPETVSGDNVC